MVAHLRRPSTATRPHDPKLAVLLAAGRRTHWARRYTTVNGFRRFLDVRPRLTLPAQDIGVVGVGQPVVTEPTMSTASSLNHMEPSGPEMMRWPTGTVVGRV
ncbi:hypothetical protein [Streptomyces decoyicus]|uniref:hypothetical protein n=1 Tax=Streptomyces decoyicus TaxID=249567 RepID=UPI0033BACC0C